MSSESPYKEFKCFPSGTNYDDFLNWCLSAMFTNDDDKKVRLNCQEQCCECLWDWYELLRGQVLVTQTRVANKVTLRFYHQLQQVHLYLNNKAKLAMLQELRSHLLPTISSRDFYRGLHGVTYQSIMMTGWSPCYLQMQRFQHCLVGRLLCGSLPNRCRP